MKYDKPVFPVSSKSVGMLASVGISIDGDGLTRRELFAAMAMQGICARRVSSGKPQTQQFVSTWAVEYADALIAELDREES